MSCPAQGMEIHGHNPLSAGNDVDGVELREGKPHAGQCCVSATRENALMAGNFSIRDRKVASTFALQGQELWTPLRGSCRDVFHRQ